MSPRALLIVKNVVRMACRHLRIDSGSPTSGRVGTS